MCAKNTLAGRQTRTKPISIFEYLGEDKQDHRYFPDFVIVKKTGEFYIVEVKSKDERGDETVEAKKKAVEKLQNLQADKVKYNIIYTKTNTIGVEDIDINTIVD